MKFRTEVDIRGALPVIQHSDKIVMLGSCFAEGIGERLKQSMLNVDINPFGTLYNPASIANALLRLVSAEPYTDADLFFFGGLWHSADHHSRFSGVDSRQVLERINTRLADSAEMLRYADHLILTFGTAYTFRDCRTNHIVANCHKQPADVFLRERLSVTEILKDWVLLLDKLKKFNPLMNITFTVSPVRHLADGAHGNQLSKATLLLAVDELLSRVGGCNYFPAYEILLDELRDYRFFDADMTHPSEVAVDYVAERFFGTCLTEEAQTAAKECRRLTSRLHHRQLTNDQEAYNRFRQSTQSLANTLIQRYPHLKAVMHKYDIAQ